MTRYLVFAVVLTASSASGAEKSSVPPDAALEAPLALIKEVFGEELAAAKTNEQLQTLAKKLFSEASKTDKPIDRYALLRVARDIATQGCDGQTSFQIIDEMDQAFQIDAVRMKASVLYSLTKNARLPADRKSIADQALALVNLAVARDDFEMSAKLAEMALSEARKVRDADFVKGVVTRIEEINEFRKAFAKVKAAAEKLEENPVDPEANLAVGRYRCLVKGDWETGLPMLALGSDASLKALATRELGESTTPTDQTELGDGWWGLAEKEDGFPSQVYRQRGAYWYRRALPQLTGGLSKAKIEKRLSMVKPVYKEAAPRRPSYVPRDAVHWKGNWYWFPDIQSDFDGAMSMATKSTGRLVVIASESEAEFVTSQLRGRTWIGARRIGGKWVNLFGQPQDFFGRGELHGGKRENWATILTSGKIGDITIHLPANKYYVCIEWGKE